MMFVMKGSGKEEATEGEVAGHSGASFIIRGTKEGHLLTTFRFPNEKGYGGAKSNPIKDTLFLYSVYSEFLLTLPPLI